MNLSLVTPCHPCHPGMVSNNYNFNYDLDMYYEIYPDAQN